MSEKKYSKGISFAVVSLLFVSFQPIVANSRPKVIDAYIFAAMTVIIEAIIFFPLMLIELRKLKRQNNINLENKSVFIELTPVEGLKKNKILFLYLGINFGIAQILYFVAYELAGVANGAIAAQTSIIFALLFGYLINHERVSKIQIIFSFVLFFGLFIAITQGTFNVFEFNLGVLIMLICAALWMSGHTITKPILDKGEITPTQLMFFRNSISAIFLFSTYFLFYPISNIGLFFSPINWIFFLLIGILYSIDLFYWYKALSHINVSKASIIVSCMPLLAAFLAFLILGELFTVYHLIGTLIVITSIIIITNQRVKPQEVIK